MGYKTKPCGTLMEFSTGWGLSSTTRDNEPQWRSSTVWSFLKIFSFSKMLFRRVIAIPYVKYGKLPLALRHGGKSVLWNLYFFITLHMNKLTICIMLEAVWAVEGQSLTDLQVMYKSHHSGRGLFRFIGDVFCYKWIWYQVTSMAFIPSESWFLYKVHHKEVVERWHSNCRAVAGHCGANKLSDFLTHCVRAKTRTHEKLWTAFETKDESCSQLTL